MKRLLVLGGGTAGTIVVNKLRHRLPPNEWHITVVEQRQTHYYQPGYLFIPFGTYRPDEVTKSVRSFIPAGVDLVQAEVDRVEPELGLVRLMDGTALDYDQLVIATGTTPRPDQTPGMTDEAEWRSSIHEFYTYDGSVALSRKLKDWPGGRLVIHIVDMPIKCPVAPLEFTFLADSFFKDKDMRDQVEIVFVTPLSGAFTQPIASEQLGSMLNERKVQVESDFMIERVDAASKTLVSYDEREVPFDLLVTVPLNMGADFVGRSGLGDELNYVKVDKHTFQSTQYDNIFAVGDASNIPASKAGSVAHFSVDVFTHNFMRHIQGQPMDQQFDGHANCFVESGNGKGLLIDFNYDTQPLTGKYPLPVVGPLALLKESTLNHWGKLMFRWIYWHVLLRGRPVPLPALMSMAGKNAANEPTTTSTV
jgi:sulfide:quinone oxidoreductase